MARFLSFVVGGALLAGTVGLYFMDSGLLLESMFLSVFAFLILGGAFVSGTDESRNGKRTLSRPERNATFRSLEEPGSVINAWILSLLMSAVFGRFGYEVFTNPRHAGAPGWVKMAAVVLVLAGLWWILKATTKTLDYLSYQRVQLRLPISPVMVGDVLRGDLEISRGSDALRELGATLICRETIWHDVVDPGNHDLKKKQTSERWSTGGTFPIVQRGAGSQAALAFDIPADLPGTSHPGTFGLSAKIRYGTRYHEWLLKLDKPDRTFVIPVRSSGGGQTR
jgi:hypothetical protein